MFCRCVRIVHVNTAWRCFRGGLMGAGVLSPGRECFCLVKLAHTLGPCPAGWQHRLPGLRDGMMQRNCGGVRLKPPVGVLDVFFKNCSLWFGHQHSCNVRSQQMNTDHEHIQGLEPRVYEEEKGEVLGLILSFFHIKFELSICQTDRVIIMYLLGEGIKLC